MSGGFSVAATAASYEDIKCISNRLVEALCGHTGGCALNAHAYHALLLLRQEDGLAASELANRLGVKPPQALALLNALERADLVRRGRQRSRVSVWLTPQGRAVPGALLTPTVRDRLEMLQPEIEALRDLLLGTLRDVEGTAADRRAAA